MKGKPGVEAINNNEGMGEKGGCGRKHKSNPKMLAQDGNGAEFQEAAEIFPPWIIASGKCHLPKNPLPKSPGVLRLFWLDFQIGMEFPKIINSQHFIKIGVGKDLTKTITFFTPIPNPSHFPHNPNPSHSSP